MRISTHILTLPLWISCWIGLCSAGWNSDDLSLYDLVEEVGVGNNFYDLLDVAHDASTGDIKRAYRKLSLIYHPDKNKAEDAADKFRQLAAVYEVLKSEELRQKYNDVLEFGLPDWRQPVFYYRNLRSMPLWETLIILVVIISVAQYLMMWGAYWEQRLTLRSQILRQEKKRIKAQIKNNKDLDMDEIVDQMAEQELDKPSWRSLLPFWAVRTIIGLPHYFWERLGLLDVIILRRKAQQAHLEAHRLAVLKAQEDEAKKYHQQKERVFIEPIEYELATDNKPVSTTIDTGLLDQDNKSTVIKTGPWTLDELNYLVRLSTTKYPVGTPSRWEKMAEAIQRKPEAVTNMIGKLKHLEPNDYHKLCHNSGAPSMATPAVNPIHNNPSMASTESATTSAADWTQSEQKQLEAALIQFPKTVDDRWDKIADCIPGRNKDECLLRFKYLAQMLRQRKTKKPQDS